MILTYQSKEDEARQVMAEVIAAGRKSASLQLDISDIASLNKLVLRVKDSLREQWNTDKIDVLGQAFHLPNH